MRCLFYLAGVFSLLSLGSSCKKDNTIQHIGGCKVDTMYYNSGQYYYTYTYTDGLLTRLTYYSDHYNIEYNNATPVIRKYFVGPAVNANEYEAFIYNANGTLARIDLFAIDPPNPTRYYQYGKIVFSYSTDQLSKVEFYSINGATTTLEEDYTYTSQSGNLISCHGVDYLPTVQTADLAYTYDNNANYFKKQDPYGYILNPVFMSVNPFNLPMALSKNNVTNFLSGGSTLIATYVLNDKQDLSYFQISDGVHTGQNFHYVYKCD